MTGLLPSALTLMFGRGKADDMYIKRFPVGPVSANCYILCDEKTACGALIDPGGYSAELKNEIAVAGIKELKYILCTHGHFDHISGISAIKKDFPSAKVAIGKLDAPLLISSEKNLADFFGFPYESTSADVFLNDGDIIKIGNAELRVLFTPGHSPGGVCYINDKDKYLFSGDTLFKMTIGRTDLWGGNLTELLDSVEKLMLLPDDFTVYTGHNISTVIGDERVRNRYLRKKKQ